MGIRLLNMLCCSFLLVFARPELLGGTNVMPTTITHLQVTGAQTRIQWQGDPISHRLQWRTHANTGQWIDLSSPSAEANISFTLSSSTAFFRMVADASTNSTTARYRMVFDATWSASTHPTQFPGGAHFSGLIGGTHNSQIAFWAPGAVASPGIEAMAETGGKSTLSSEVSTAIADGTAEHVLSGGGLGSPGTVSLEFDVSANFPLVSLVSMVAPSPDWFVGVHGLDLCPDGQWLDRLTVSLQPYDSGTDSGVTYTSANADTQPAETITQITGSPFQNNNAVSPLGTFTFTRLRSQ